MINQIIEVDGQKWHVEAKSMQAALNEIAFARCTGSVGSTSTADNTQVGGGIELIAKVRRVETVTP